MKTPLAPVAGPKPLREVVVPKAKRRKIKAKNDEIALGNKPDIAKLSCPHVPLSKGFFGST